MEEKVKAIFNLDDSLIQDKKIKSIFYNHESFNADKQRIFDDNIESIKLTALFNDETINITPYKDEEYVYEEIYLITVQLKTDKNSEKIINLIHFLIPNPVMLVLVFGDKILTSGSISRINKNNEEKAILEEIYQSIWLPIDSDSGLYQEAIMALNTKGYSYHCLRDFYEDFLKVTLLSNFIEMISEFKYSSKYDVAMLIDVISRFRVCNMKISALKNEQAQAPNFGDKVALQNNILKIEQELEFIKNQARELIKNL